MSDKRVTRRECEEGKSFPSASPEGRTIVALDSLIDSHTCDARNDLMARRNDIAIS